MAVRSVELVVPCEELCGADLDGSENRWDLVLTGVLSIAEGEL